ncbi:MAG TPA: tetratricopeptide repeat protein, partial [Thermomicrobiales bacterium]|nr:tetratricopeptide repeat protein [Thermomicrobiales bacterium]
GAGGDAAPAFGALLRGQRERAGLTQEELAARAGVSAQAVGALERGARRRPHPATVRRLADALGLAGAARAALLASAAPPGPAPAPPAPAAPSPPELPELPARPDLPAPLTALVGRADDVARVAALLRGGARLVTLTGPGGVGKTRLALAVAAALAGDFADGAAFVPLAPLADAATVLPAVARALGLGEAPGQEPGAALRAALHGRRLLVVLDNCEHLPALAAPVAALLEGCAGLAVLATSRAPLRVRGERRCPVAPLALPAFDRAVTLAEAARSPAVLLFAERAQAARPDFALTAANASAVAALCGRLDGLPLAIELAAARVALLPPAALLARLHRALPLLTGGAADLPTRHQTLRATIAWSENLLDDDARALFRRLAVFAGGFDLAAIAAEMRDEKSEVRNERGEVSNAQPGDDSSILMAHFSLLAALVDQGLVRAEGGGEDGEPRFAMLETIREYAAERLAASGEEAAARARHLDYFMALAEEAAPRLTGPDQAAWLDRLEREHANFRAALGWALDSGAAETGLRLAGALHWFWYTRGYFAEGRGWLERALAAPGAAPDGARARALTGAGMLAWRQGDHAPAEARLREAATFCQARGDGAGNAYALHYLAHVLEARGAYAPATRLLEESLARYRAAGDRWGLAQTLNCLGAAYHRAGDDARATPLLEEALALGRADGDQDDTANALRLLGLVAYGRGDDDAAAALLEESLASFRAVGDRRGIALTLESLGAMALRRGEADRATALYRESLAVCRASGDTPGIATDLDDLAAVAESRDQHARAARLRGAADAARATIGAARPAPGRAAAGARAALGEAAWAAAFAAGRALPLAEVIAYALETDGGAPPAPEVGAARPAGGQNRAPALSRRPRTIGRPARRKPTG